MFATAEMRSVTDAIRIQAQMAGSSRQSIFAEAPDGASLAVVTSTPVRAGASLDRVHLLASVSDRPVFVIQTEVPLFRDLRLNDSGTDVRALQESLGVIPDGKVGSDTIVAISQLYSKAGFSTPGAPDVHLKLSEFRSIAVGATTLASIAEVGQVLSEETPLATVASGLPYAEVRATVREADQIDVGAVVKVETSNAQEFSGRVEAVSEFREADVEAGQPPGRDIRLEFDDGDSPAPGAPITAVFGEASAPRLAVPTIAVRSDSAGTYLMMQRDDRVVRVDAVQLGSSAGWTAIRSSEIGVGDRVMVSG